VLGWVRGAWCELADLDRLFRLRVSRHINGHGFVRFRHWRLYGERGLAHARAAVWIHGETLTIVHETETLAQYQVKLEADGRCLREISEPRLYATRHASQQPFLPSLDALEWSPARRLTPYRPRRQRGSEGTQGRLFEVERGISTG